MSEHRLDQITWPSGQRESRSESFEQPSYSIPVRSGAPDIHLYEDYRKYLKDRFAELNARDRTFSQRRLARDSSIPNPGFFNEVIKGRRGLTPASASKFAKGLLLSDDEAEFLIALAKRAECRDPVSKQLAEKRLARLRKKNRFSNVAFRPAAEKPLDIFSELQLHWNILSAHITIAGQKGQAVPPDFLSQSDGTWRSCLDSLKDIRELAEESAEKITDAGGPVFQITLSVRPSANWALPRIEK